MDLLSEIREGLAMVRPGKALDIEALKSEAPAWIVRDVNWFGTAVEYPKSDVISEKFSNAKIWTKLLTIGGVQKNFLLLTASREELRHEFASLCAEFCEPSERDALIADPLSWWKKWRELLGNAVRDKRVYDVIGEMIVFEELIHRNPETKWMALQSATHDLVSGKNSYEVKSTIKRYESIINVSSQYQLEADNENLSVVFCRFEPTPKGVSINGMVERLVHAGCTREMLEEGLESMGLEMGRSARNDTYRLLETVEYPVDEEFPRITDASFTGGAMPVAIESIVYAVNLGLVANKRNFLMTTSNQLLQIE